MYSVYNVHCTCSSPFFVCHCVICGRKFYYQIYARKSHFIECALIFTVSSQWRLIYSSYCSPIKVSNGDGLLYFSPSNRKVLVIFHLKKKKIVENETKHFHGNNFSEFKSTNVEGKSTIILCLIWRSIKYQRVQLRQFRLLCSSHAWLQSIVMH